jgi:hypothetical protein
MNTDAQSPKIAWVTWACPVLLLCHPYVSGTVARALWLTPTEPQPLGFTMLEKLGYGLLLLVVGAFSFYAEKRKRRICRIFGGFNLLVGLFWGLGGLVVGALYLSAFVFGKPLGP